MLQAFTRNCKDNSTDAGFQFTFCCDVCQDGYKSSFIQSETYKKRKASSILGQSAGLVGSLLGGMASQMGNVARRGSDILSQSFDGKSPEWLKEHEKAFERAQNEAQPYFHRCPNDYKYVCDHCWNEDEGLCVSCAPRQEIYVAQARAQALKRNIDEAGQSATVWKGAIESKTTICHSCGKPAGTGKFCNNCGASMEFRECPKCGTKNPQAVRFCNNCGENLQQPTQAAPSAAVASICPSCGKPGGTGKFCNNCGASLEQASAPAAICHSCGKPAGTGKFCNNCGASMESRECPKCGTRNAQDIRFCTNCGENLQQTAAPSGRCSACGFDNPPGTKYCGSCGALLNMHVAGEQK